MKKIFITFILFLSVFSCKSKLEDQMYLDLNEFKEHVLDVENKINFIKNDYFTVGEFDIEKELLKTIKDHRNDLKKIEKESKDKRNQSMSDLKNKIMDEFITKYNNRLSKPIFSSLDDMTMGDFFKWMAKQEILEKKLDIDLNALARVMSIMDFNERIDIVNISKKFEQDPIRFRLTRTSIKTLYSISSFISEDKVYYKDIKWEKSTYSGAYIIGKIVNDSSKKVSGIIRIPIHRAATNEYIGYASKFFDNIPPYTTYSFKVLANFDGTAYFNKPELEYMLEK